MLKFCALIVEEVRALEAREKIFISLPFKTSLKIFKLVLNGREINI